MEIRILVKVPSVWVYLLLNGASAVTVLALMRETDVFSANNMIQGLGAGVGAVLLLRSSLMHLKVGDSSVDAGLFQLTKIFLNTAERGVIRGGNKRFSDAIKEIMRNVDFAKAQTALPLICLELAEDVSKEQAHQLGVEIAEVRADSSIEEHAKTLWLGIKIGRLTGTDLLSAVVEQLGDQIKTTNENEDQNETSTRRNEA